MRNIRKHTLTKVVLRVERKKRIRRKLKKMAQPLPRLVVFKSNYFIYTQVIDDLGGATLVSANTREKEFANLSSKKNMEAAKLLGKTVGERAKKANIDKVFFDRNGYDYHGRVAAVADGAREAGLAF